MTFCVLSCLLKLSEFIQLKRFYSQNSVNGYLLSFFIGTVQILKMNDKNTAQMSGTPVSFSELGGKTLNRAHPQ